MNRTNMILLGLLLLQGLGFAYQIASRDDVVDAGPRGLLLEGLVVDDVTALAIDDGTTEDAVTLTRADDGWVVADRWDHPADGKKLDELLRELMALEIADVVSKSGLHLVELGVGADDYTKKVTITSGATSSTLYLGTSGRGSSTHTRVDGDERVVAVRDFSTWRVNARPDTWVHRSVVDLDPESVIGLELLRGDGGIVLTKEGDTWLLDGAPADATAVDALVKKAAKVTLSAVTGPAEGALPGELLAVVLRTADGATTWRVAPGAAEGKFAVAVDGGSHVVEIGKWAVESLLDATAESLAADIPMEAPEQE